MRGSYVNSRQVVFMGLWCNILGALEACAGGLGLCLFTWNLRAVILVENEVLL